MSNLDIGRLKKEDCSELIVFLNNVFTIQNGYEMHFENLYPRIFKESDKAMNWHLAAKDDGKICGVVASYPFKYHIGDTVLTVAAMGNVAVDTKYRGQGIMQELMKRMCLENKEEGIDLCYLHGDRWRYRNFGFERCGRELSLEMRASMLREYGIGVQYKFVEITPQNNMLTDRLFDFYNSQKTYEERGRDTFFEAMTAKGHITYVILSDNDDVQGYVTVSAEKDSFIEISLVDNVMLADVLKSYMQEKGLEIIRINVPEYSGIVKEAFKYADRYSVFQPGNFLVLNFKNVVEAFMLEKNKYDTLVDGSISIDSDVFGKWIIKKDASTISVCEFDGVCDIKLEGYSAYQLLFGTLPLNENCKKDNIVKSWFPLPLYCPYLS